MNHIKNGQMLWLNSTIDSLIDMLDDKEFTPEQAVHVEETVKALYERKEKLLESK